MAIDLAALGSYGVKKILYVTSGGALAWTDITIESGNLRFPTAKGIQNSDGSAGLYLSADGNIRFDQGPGAAVIWADNALGYDARNWYINLGISSGYLDNQIKLHTSVDTQNKSLGFTFYDDNNISYPMCVSYKQRQSMDADPANPFKAWLGFTDDIAIHYNFRTDDAGNCETNTITTHGDIMVQKTLTPATPAASQQGTPGSTTYTYKLSYVLINGKETEATANITTTTGNATLNGSNFNRITWDNHPYADFTVPAKWVKVWRTVGGATQGLIGTFLISEAHFDDTGLAGDGGTPPTLNQTGNVMAEGGFYTKKNEAPADSDLVAGQLMHWFDPTNGAAKVKFKGKTLNGTVVTAEVAMA
jgi:hypothetical protein